MIPSIPKGRQYAQGPSRCLKAGFSLVMTLMLMILLSVIVVGLLSLSSIALRTSAQTEAIGVARANAKLAVQLAIGELQTQAGIDTRITARAELSGGSCNEYRI